MEAYIKYLGDIHDNYTRCGKVIPFYEKKIDIQSFFGVNENTERTVIEKLKSDKKIKFNLIKSAGETQRQEVSKIEKKRRYEKIEDNNG